MSVYTEKTWPDGKFKTITKQIQGKDTIWSIFFSQTILLNKIREKIAIALEPLEVADLKHKGLSTLLILTEVKRDNLMSS